MQITSWMKHCGGEDGILSRKKGEESRSNHGVTGRCHTRGGAHLWLSGETGKEGRPVKETSFKNVLST